MKVVDDAVEVLLTMGQKIEIRRQTLKGVRAQHMFDLARFLRGDLLVNLENFNEETPQYFEPVVHILRDTSTARGKLDLSV